MESTTPIRTNPFGLKAGDRGLTWIYRAAGGVSALALTSLTTTLLAILPAQVKPGAASPNASIGSAMSRSGTPFQSVVRRVLYLALLLLPASLMLPLLLWFGDASGHAAK